MVLASTSNTTTIENLTKLADKFVEVAAPTVAAISASPCPEIIMEIEQLWAKVQKMQIALRQLARQSRSHSQSRGQQHSLAPQNKQLTGGTKGMYGSSKAKKCSHTATTPSRQTTRPAIGSDRHIWPHVTYCMSQIT